jgi:hypothetical protein
MKKVLYVYLFIFFFAGTLSAQNNAGENATAEYRYLIDLPTTGVVEKGTVGITMDLMPNGIMLSRMEVGVFDDISFGISYGGSNIIGSGDIDWYEYPGVNLRYKIIQESLLFPSITVGFDSQGKGFWFDDPGRYAIKSPGFFAAASKNYQFLGYLSLHGSVNYSLENADGENFTNFMVGIEKTIGSRVSVMFDYNFGLNDNGSDKFGKGNGYLNLGIRFAVADGFTLGLDLRDLLDNKQWSPSSADRALRLEYAQRIL